MVVSGCGTASGMEFAVGDCIRDSVNANGQAEPVDCPTDDSVRIQKLANNGAQPTCERGYYPSPKGFLYSKETIYRRGNRHHLLRRARLGGLYRAEDATTGQRPYGRSLGTDYQCANHHGQRSVEDR
jgi:hypothetical protein